MKYIARSKSESVRVQSLLINLDIKYTEKYIKYKGHKASQITIKKGLFSC